MRIRITGTEPELEYAVRCIAAVLPVREVSGRYPNHNAVTSRIYLDTGSIPVEVEETMRAGG